MHPVRLVMDRMFPPNPILALEEAAMKKITRRTALHGISGAGLAALLSASVRADEAPAKKSELFVVGPFKLGEWFDKSKATLEGFFHQGAPERKEIVKSLKECFIYVIDLRIWEDDKKPSFGASDKPKLVATGKLHHVWKDKKKSFMIQVSELTVAVNHTNYDTSPPCRTVCPNIRLKTAGSIFLGDTTSTYSLCPKGDIVYDINGRLK